MNERVINLPEFQHIADLEPELNAFSDLLNSLFSEDTDAHLAGFSILTAFSSGVIDELKYGYDFSQSSAPGINRQKVIETLGALVTPAYEFEKTNPNSSGSLKLVIDAWKRVINPNIKYGFDWHSGDPDRFFISNLGTEFFAGELVVPSGYRPNSRASDNPINDRAFAGSLLKSLMEEGDVDFTKDLDIITAAPGELIRFDKHHVHRSPVNNSESPFNRIIVRMDPRYS